MIDQQSDGLFQVPIPFARLLDSFTSSGHYRSSALGVAGSTSKHRINPVDELKKQLQRGPHSSTKDMVRA